MENHDVYIKYIKEAAQEVAVQRGHWLYKVKGYWVRFWERGGIVENGMEFTPEKDGLFWDFCTPKAFWDTYLSEPALNYLEHQVRFLGGTRMTRPGQLKKAALIGVSTICSNKIRCQIYLHDQEIWIRYTDGFNRGLEQQIECGKLKVEEALQLSRDHYESRWEITHPVDNQAFYLIEAWIQIKNLPHFLKNGVSTLQLAQQLIQQQDAYYGAMWTPLHPSERMVLMQRTLYLISEHFKKSTELAS